MTRTRWFGLIGGLLTFIVMLLLPAPAGMELTAWHVAALTVLMAIWWMTEALPLTVTALLPFLTVPAFGVMDANAIHKNTGGPVNHRALCRRVQRCKAAERRACPGPPSRNPSGGRGASLPPTYLPVLLLKGSSPNSWTFKRRTAR